MLHILYSLLTICMNDIFDFLYIDLTLHGHRQYFYQDPELFTLVINFTSTFKIHYLIMFRYIIGLLVNLIWQNCHKNENLLKKNTQKTPLMNIYSTLLQFVIHSWLQNKRKYSYTFIIITYIWYCMIEFNNIIMRTISKYYQGIIFSTDHVNFKCEHDQICLFKEYVQCFNKLCNIT